MRHIQKGSPPRDLVATAKATTTNLATSAGARTAYDQLDKSGARTVLAREQAGLCAFCNRRIDPERKDAHGQPSLKIAHRTPIDVDPSMALTWTNLLGSCDGGQSSGTSVRTCDAAQGSTALSLDPTRADHVARVRFETREAREGLFVTANDEALRVDVENTLGLNRGDLPAHRLAAWRAFQRLAAQSKAYGRAERQALLEQRRTRAGASLPEYFGVLESKVR
jgi:uncharacterized protein (TIGR02646 family)